MRPRLAVHPALPQHADGRLVVMGVLNVTPDSFSDGGRWVDSDRAVAHGLELCAQGADLVDVGGESTRPGATAVAAEEERRRIVPVVRELATAGVPVSVDTYHAVVAEAALEAGARIVNDVSGGLGDPDMARVVAAAGCPWILMHSRGPSDTMQALAHYDPARGGVVQIVHDDLAVRVEAAVAAGVELEALVLDPGLGFAKTGTHDWQLLAHLEVLESFGLPVLVGASRKSFLGRVLARDGEPRPVDQREDATTAITAWCATRGVWGVRVHEVRASVDAARTIAAIRTVSRDA